MDLTHEFTVPAPVGEVWDALNDIESVAGCFPGATVTGVDGDTFTGSCKVKLGPIALVYNGTGTFVELDETSHTMRIEAKGKDKRGNGTAGADVTATMVETDGQTRVEVITDLNITGKPAQFGRGVIQDVSDKLLGQFVDCLAEKVTGPGEVAAPEAADAPQEVATGPAASGEGPPPSSSPGSTPPSPAPSPGAASQAAGPGAEDDALDLGATVIPILLKSYGKQLAAALGVLAVLVWVVRRRR